MWLKSSSWSCVYEYWVVGFGWFRVEIPTISLLDVGKGGVGICLKFKGQSRWRISARVDSGVRLFPKNCVFRLSNNVKIYICCGLTLVIVISIL